MVTLDTTVDLSRFKQWKADPVPTEVTLKADGKREILQSDKYIIGQNMK